VHPRGDHAGIAARIIGIEGHGGVRHVECLSERGQRLVAQLESKLAARFQVGQAVTVAAERVMIDLQPQ
jgi:hypothetical protein